ncbi:LuxR C-terminal-related transcriptional regulator [Chloroflexota bacterium]
MYKIPVFVISNNTLYRHGLRQALSQSDDIEVIAESVIDDDALELVVSSSPEIVLLDIGLPLLTGLNLGRQITQRSPAISVIVIAPYNGDDSQLFQAIKVGAAGYLTIDASADETASAIRRIHQGEYIINDLVLARPRVAEKVLKQFQDFSMMGGAMETLATPLTSRELEVLSYAAQGYSNKQIAYKLGVSQQTIKNHMTSILRKLDANDRTQAVVLALDHGWISTQLNRYQSPRKATKLPKLKMLFTRVVQTIREHLKQEVFAVLTVGGQKFKMATLIDGGIVEE